MKRPARFRHALLTLVALAALAFSAFLSVAFARLALQSLSRERLALRSRRVAALLEDARTWTEVHSNQAASDEWIALPIDPAWADGASIVLEVCRTSDEPTTWHACVRVSTEFASDVREASWRTPSGQRTSRE